MRWTKREESHLFSTDSISSNSFLIDFTRTSECLHRHSHTFYRLVSSNKTKKFLRHNHYTLLHTHSLLHTSDMIINNTYNDDTKLALSLQGYITGPSTMNRVWRLGMILYFQCDLVCMSCCLCIFQQRMLQHFNLLYLLELWICQLSIWTWCIIPFASNTRKEVNIGHIQQLVHFGFFLAHCPQNYEAGHTDEVGYSSWH